MTVRAACKAAPVHAVPSRMSDAATRTVFLIGLFLVFWYTLRYLGDQSLPGNQAAHPEGWWGWFDQSVTLRSTVALAICNLDHSQHHYPLGYSLLGLLLYRAAPNHPFFFVDLLCLLGALAGFIGLARRLGLAAALAAALFVLVTVFDPALFRQWVVPWNTTPIGGFGWPLLACCAAWLDGRRRPLVVGLLAGSIVVCRPTDALVFLPCMITLAWAERRARAGRLAEAVRVVAGAALVAVPAVVLHLAIYGPNESLYMRNSAQIGFTLHDLGWKAYVLLIDPNPWFADGEGLLQHAHWIALGLAGLVPAFVRGPKDRMLAGVLLIHGVLYVSYVDLLPTGLWRFLNVHYFAWTVPGYALVAALLLRDLTMRGPPRIIALVSLVGTLALLCVRVVPRAAAQNEPAKAADFVGPLPPFLETYLGGKLALQDKEGVLRDTRDIRAFLYPGGVRVIGLRRDIAGPALWLPDAAPQGFAGTEPSARWAIAVQFAWPPRWLRRASASGLPVPAS